MKKILCLIIVLISTMFFVAGCRKPDNPTELHEWHTDENDKRTAIIYEVKSVPTEIVDGNLYWDIDNVQMEFKFGWYEKRNPDFILENESLELACFAAYFFWPEDEWNKYSYNYDDYKNPTNAIFLKEISIDEFLSDKYKANYGKSSGFLKTNPPIFNELHESLIIKLSQEVFKISEEKHLNNSNSFRFGVTPVYRVSSGGFFVEFGCKYDGFRFKYSKYSDTDKIYISYRP